MRCASSRAAAFARGSLFAMCVALLAAVPHAAVATSDEAAGPALVRTYCAGCHRETSRGQFDRISSIRKSPEGWVMTVFRMHNVHGVALPERERDAIVRHLADTQGLAPSESAAGRFALERRPNVRDLVVDSELDRMCGRCHTNARVSLQRRDAAEWLKLAHTHVGQWPSLEYQASGRDRPWWHIATTRLPGALATLYPFASPAWSAWRSRPAHDLSGRWIIAGRVPGRGAYYGTAQIRSTGDGAYAATYSLHTVDGRTIVGTSSALLYTGYEWRGRASFDGRDTREVFAASEDGTRIAGRWFDADHAEDGGDWLAVRADAAPQVVAVEPQAVRAGTTATVVLVGPTLDDVSSVEVGAGIAASIVERSPGALRVRLVIPKDAAPGRHRVAVGAASGALAVYRQIDRIDVTPDFGIARLGGGRIAPVTAQFEARGFTRLADGSDLALGPLDAEWSAAPFDDEAARTRDALFAGRLEPDGRFVPAVGGPNPAREFSGNNVGNLAIEARVRDGDRVLAARAHLVVTVQRWNTPPIY
jgi:quinohemoprotein amine dehydrogenase